MSRKQPNLKPTTGKDVDDSRIVELTNRAADLDSEAFAELVGCLWPREVPLAKKAIERAGASTVRESDVAATTFRRATELFQQGKFPRVSTSKELYAWLKTLRHGKAVDKKRKEKTDRGLGRPLDDFDVVIAERHDRGGVLPDVDADMKERVDRLLKQLSSRELAIVRCVEGGTKLKAIPKILEQEFGKVTRSMIDRTREKWERLLKDEFSTLR
jgi:DNA-directed RNA polymerase specialized sigma24 family protein